MTTSIQKGRPGLAASPLLWLPRLRFFAKCVGAVAVYYMANVVLRDLGVGPHRLIAFAVVVVTALVDAATAVGERWRRGGRLQLPSRKQRTVSSAA